MGKLTKGFTITKGVLAAAVGKESDDEAEEVVAFNLCECLIFLAHFVQFIDSLKLLQIGCSLF